MKILIASDTLMGGGTEKLIADMAPRLKKDGHEVEILVLTEKNEKYKKTLENVGIRVMSMDTVKGYLKKILFLYRKIKEKQYDLVHANLFPMFYFVALTSLLPGRRKPVLVMTEHNTDNRRRHKKYLRPIERFIYRRFKRIISISAMTQKQLQGWLRFPKKDEYRFKVIKNGIPINEFTYAKPIKKEELFPSYIAGDVLLGMIGSFSVQKNHAAMLEILKILPEKYILVCAGEGPLLCEIQEKAKTNGLINRVVFLGFQKDIARVMHTMDIIVIPSVWEGFGLVAVEAMACGKPVVAADVPGLAEVVGQFGLLGDTSDPKDFAALIRSLEDKATYKTYSERSSQRAEAFSIKKTVAEYEKLYTEVIDCY